MSDTFLSHLAGTVALTEWLARWQVFPGSIKQAGPWLHLLDLPSQRFGLGVAKRFWFARHPFLLAQQDELAWLSRILFTQACLVQQPSMLCLLAAEQSRGSHRFPAFGISIAIDDAAKHEWLGATGRLSLRGLWFEGAITHVEQGPPRWTLPVTHCQTFQALDERNLLAEKTFDWTTPSSVEPPATGVYLR